MGKFFEIQVKYIRLDKIGYVYIRKDAEKISSNLIDKLNIKIDIINSMFYTIDGFSLGWGLKDDNLRTN